MTIHSKTRARLRGLFHPPPSAFDLTIAVVLTVSMQVELLMVKDPSARVASFLAGFLMTAPLMFRRRAPLVVAGVACAALIGQELLDGRLMDGPITAPGVVPILAYSVARFEPLRWAGVGLALVLGSLIAVFALSNETVLTDYLIVPGVFVVAPWLAGRALRARERQVEKLHELNMRLDADQEQRAQLAVAQERIRLARELHDVVAHGVTTMIVQAGAAEQVQASDPARASESLKVIQETGETTVNELRQMLGVLRDGAENSALAPAPGLNDLDQLVEGFESSGLRVNLTRLGEPRRLSAGTELSAYRIVQEALTNTLKHARAAQAWVTITYDALALTVEVRDDGAGTGAMNREPGHGILGMRERVASFGGELTIGPKNGIGFDVRARIPLAAGRSD